MTPLTVRPIYSSKLRTAQMMIFLLVAMIGLEKCCITSACLQWLCHSGERTVARGPLVCFNHLFFFVSDWRPEGLGFNPSRCRQNSFMELDHEIFSTVILSLPLIQEGQRAASEGQRGGKRGQEGWPAPLHRTSWNTVYTPQHKKYATEYTCKLKIFIKLQG